MSRKRARKPTALQVRIHTTRKEHPDWSQRRIAQELGCTEHTVSRTRSPEALAAYQAYHRAQKRKDGRRKSQLNIRYGITPDEYNRLKESQGGTCAICLTARGVRKNLAVDHDHHHEGDLRESVRGLLCSPCNNMLGRAGDNPAFFHRAIDYLTNPPARAVLGFGSEGE